MKTLKFVLTKTQIAKHSQCIKLLGWKIYLIYTVMTLSDEKKGGSPTTKLEKICETTCMQNFWKYIEKIEKQFVNNKVKGKQKAAAAKKRAEQSQKKKLRVSHSRVALSITSLWQKELIETLQIGTWVLYLRHVPSVGITCWCLQQTSMPSQLVMYASMQTFKCIGGSIFCDLNS